MIEYKKTYEIEYGPPRIKCLVCGMVSHNPNDIAYLYCGNCHAYHTILLDKNGKPKTDLKILPDT
jgi:Zn finger protein HypA/HybF involved in hydrogenase expression